MEKQNLFDKETVKLTFILFAFAAVVALLLGLVNQITAPRIAAAKNAAMREAMGVVLDAETYEEVPYTGDDSNIVAIYKAGDAGYVVECSVSGSQGMVGMVVGITTDMECSGISITSSSETAGLGANASAETEVGVNFRAQFVGTTAPVAVDKDGGEINSLTGATVTSRAITVGVNSAFAAVAALG